jgi:G3E family GTPase
LVELAEKSDKENQAAEALAAKTHDHTHDAAICTDPTHDHSHDAATCTDPTHDHSHDAATCTDPTHDHSHDAATCTDPTHDHSHDAATCTDPTHDHSHGATSHSPATTTAEERFGITSFVYKRRLPFHPGRFSMFLQGLGKLSVKGISEITGGDKTASTGDNEALLVAKKSLLRSKGFVWMGTSKTAAYFISHAGQYLELMVLGRWWADINKAEWPKGSEDEITVDFDGVQGNIEYAVTEALVLTVIPLFSSSHLFEI